MPWKRVSLADTAPSSTNAWRRSSAESCVQLFVAGGTGAERSSAACRPGHGGRGAEAVVATICRDVRQGGASVDSAGATFACTVAADAVLDPQRTIVDGRNRLQHLVSLVCGVEPGR